MSLLCARKIMSCPKYLCAFSGVKRIVLVVDDILFIFLLNILHLCALKMRMEPLLFADENAPEWAFSKRKGVKMDLCIREKALN